MTGIRQIILGSVLAIAGVLPVSGFAAMPDRPVATAGDVTDVRTVCDFNSCWDPDEPPPGWGRPPPPPGWGRPPPPPPPGWGRPPPPPPGYYRPPPPPDYYRPPPPPDYYRPRPPRDPYDPPRMSRRHVEWCLDRYQSYNPRTNSYLGRDGRFRQCRSPF